MPKNNMSFDEKVSAFWSKVSRTDNPDDCWEWTAYRDKAGYGIVKWGEQSGPASRVAWLLTFGAIPDGLFALHSCDNPPCCNPSHLFLGTKKTNTDDMIRKGRWSPPPRFSGEAHPGVKLSDEQVAEIRRRYRFKGKDNGVSLAKEFGVEHTQIYNIVRFDQRATGEEDD